LGQLKPPHGRLVWQQKHAKNPAILPLVAAWRLQTPLTGKTGDLDRNAAPFAAIPIFRVTR